MLETFIAFLCVFMYYLSPYRLAGYPLPEIIGLFAVVLQFFYIRKFKVPTHYGLFFFYMLLIPPIITVSAGLPGNAQTSFIPVALILYSLFFVVLLQNTDADKIIKIYALLVYVAIGFFATQEVSFFLFGSRPTPYLTFLEMYYEDMSFESFTSHKAIGSRSSSFFLEPAHFAQYILPYFCIVCCNAIRKKKFSIELVLLSITLLWIRAGSGYVGIVSFLLFVVLGAKEIKLKNKLWITFVAVLLSVVIYYFFSDNALFINTLERANELSSEEQMYGSRSGFLRIWRGYYIYDVLPLINQIFGVGVGSLQYVSNLVIFMSFNDVGTYFNGIQMLLITGGVVGTLLFVRFLLPFYRNCSFDGKSIIITMIGLFFVENMWFTPKMFLYLLLAYAVSHASEDAIFFHNRKKIK